MADKNLNSITFPGLPDKYKVAQVADEYSSSSTYAVGDIVNYLGTTYRCTTAITTAENWTAGHWTPVKIAKEVTDLKSSLNAVTEHRNLLPTGTKSVTFGTVVSTYNNGQYHASGTATGSGGRTSSFATVDLIAGTYTVSVSDVYYNGTQPTIFLQKSSDNTIIKTIYSESISSPYTFTLDADTRVYIGTNVVDTKTYDFYCKLQLEAGEIATDYISPFGTAVDAVVRDNTARLHDIIAESPNLLPVASQTMTVNSVTASYKDGVLTLSGTGSANGGRTNAVIGGFMLKAGTYTLSFYPKLAINFFVQKIGSVIIAQSSNMADTTFSLDSDTRVYIGFNTVENTIYNESFSVQIQSGSQKTKFYPPSFVTAIDRIARTKYVTPEMFGAVGDGETNDYEAFNAAVNSGYPVYLQEKYLLSAVNEVGNRDYICDLPDGLKMFGHGTIIFPENSYLLSEKSLGLNLFHLNGSDYHFENFTINMNGLNNIVPSGRTLTMYAFFGQAYDSVFNSIKIINSAGRNMIYINSGDNVTIKNCVFYDGGTTLQDNVNQNDFSYLYLHCTNTLVDGSTIDSEHLPITNCGGIELHGSNSRAVNNYINNAFVGVYISSDEKNDILKNIDVLGNTILTQNGIVIWRTNKYENIKIIGNNIVSKWGEEDALTGVSCISTVYTNTTNQELNNIVISHNILDVVSYNPVNANNDVAISLRNTTKAIISGNIIKAYHKGIIVRAEVQDITISGNQVDSKSPVHDYLFFVDDNTTIGNILITDNDLNNMYITNSTDSSNVKAICKYTDIRPISNYYSTGIYTTIDTGTIAGWTVKFTGNIITAYRTGLGSTTSGTSIGHPISIVPKIVNIMAEDFVKVSDITTNSFVLTATNVSVSNSTAEVIYNL